MALHLKADALLGRSSLRVPTSAINVRAHLSIPKLPSLVRKDSPKQTVSSHWQTLFALA